MIQKISRENALKFIELVRKQISFKTELFSYLDSCTDFEKIEIKTECMGVSNGFLSEVIYTITGYKVEVYGNVENLFTCPCCGLKTLTERFDIKNGTGYDICPYCNWEDDGTIDTTVYRAINKGSIEDYRENIKKNFNRYYINKWLE